MKCPYCGHQKFKLEVVYLVGYVPEVVCQQPGGSYAAGRGEYYICRNCGKELNQDEWEAAARATYEESTKKVLVPEDMKPDDNGKE